MLSKYDVATLGQTAKTAMASDTFAVIDGIGPEKSASFIKWFKDEHNYSVFEALLKEVTVKESAPVSAGGKCDGLVFVVTGDVYKYKNRSELKAYIESQGGKVQFQDPPVFSSITISTPLPQRTGRQRSLE